MSEVVMSVVTEFDASTHDEAEELRLWSVYITAVNNKHRLENECHDAWRSHVISNVKFEVYTAASDRWAQARVLAGNAYVAWKRVAYPLKGWPLPDEDDDVTS